MCGGEASQEDTRDDAITQLYNLHAFALFEHKKVTVIVAGEGVDATVVEGPADRVLLLADDRLCAGREDGEGGGWSQAFRNNINMTDTLSACSAVPCRITWSCRHVVLAPSPFNN